MCNIYKRMCCMSERMCMALSESINNLLSSKKIRILEYLKFAANPFARTNLIVTRA